MSAPNDVAALVVPVGYLKPSSHWTQHPEYVAASAWNDHPWMRGVFTIPVFGERSVAALQAEVERAREDERDRLYRKANADYIEAEERGDAIAQEWHSAAAGWLGHNGGKSEDDRDIARSTSRKENTP